MGFCCGGYGGGYSGGYGGGYGSTFVLIGVLFILLIIVGGPYLCLLFGSDTLSYACLKSLVLFPLKKKRARHICCRRPLRFNSKTNI